MKRKMKNNLFLATAICLVAAVMLTSASYAWFTSVINTDVQNIDMYVNAADAMMFSALESPGINNAGDWRVSLQKTEITAANRGNQANAFPQQMLNVSSLFSGASHNFYTASFSESGSLEGYTAIPQPNNFVKISLWVKSTRSGFVYLNEGSLLSALSTVAPKNAVEYTTRVGFVPVNYDVNGEEAGGVIAGEAFDYAVLWEPNSTSHLDVLSGGPGGNSKIVAHAVTGTNISDVSSQATYDFGNLATNINDTDYFNGNTTTPQTVIVPEENKKIALFNINMDTMQQFNIYIWVEGTDADTVNAIAKSSFRTYLKFGQEYNVFKGNLYKSKN